jgi:hypothetical protein
MNSKLFEDIKVKLENIRIEGDDERSGALSEVKSNILKTLSTLGGSRMSQFQSWQIRTSPRRYTEQTKPNSRGALLTPKAQGDAQIAEGDVVNGLQKSATASENYIQ